MSDRSSKPHRSHKRQKSSLTNIGYYFPDQQATQQPSQQPSLQTFQQFPHQRQMQQPQQQQTRQQQQSRQQHPGHNRQLSQSSQLSPHQYQLASISSQSSQPSQQSQAQLSFYDYDPYNTMNYNFSSATAPSSSTGTGHNIIQGIPPTKAIPSPGRGQFGPTPFLPYQSPTQYTIPGSVDQNFGTIPQMQLQSGQYNSEAPNVYEQFTYPKSVAEFNDVPQSETNTSVQEKQPTKHNKNLSVSTRFNLFNLNENEDQGERETDAKPTAINPLFNDFLQSLVNVDGSNINNYLLQILEKLGSPLPIDDFYNFLYNNDKQASPTPVIPTHKIDKTMVNFSIQSSAFSLLDQLLNIFKIPNLLIEYFPNIANRENKLFGINYHELLRTFLAIKILYDVLIQLPSNNDPQNYTIPRLSIYKTYYIICQKLIRQYPSPTNTSSEQQKLILGQSKLGKLLKLVYPDLLIKRLGSRGDSKYNYLGVIWNQNIIDDEIKKLCDENELVHLHRIFDTKDKNLSFPRRRNHSTNSYTSIPGHKIKLKTRSKSEPQIQLTRPHTEPYSNENIIAPSFSFIKPHLKFPESDNFTILEEKDKDNWFITIKHRAYEWLKRCNLSFSIPEAIQLVFLNNDNLVEKHLLCNGLINKIVKPLSSDLAYVENADLYLYLIAILELLPYLLFLKSYPQVNYLKNLRLNLLYLIDNFNDELATINTNNHFKIEHLRRFLILMKKLININDLLITFIKLVNKDDSSNSSVMVLDIENYLNLSDESPSDIGIDEDSESRLSFKNDILSKDLIYALNAYNLDPTLDQHSRSVLSTDFIWDEVNLIGNFFRIDLLNFLNDQDLGEKYELVTSTEPNDETDSILSKKEGIKLASLLTLIHDKLLTKHFKAKYPILVYTNILSLILNDSLKYIFIKYQKQQNNQHKDENQNSFGNWWVFNSFVQEYSSLMGEIVGLYDSV